MSGSVGWLVPERSVINSLPLGVLTSRRFCLAVCLGDRQKRERTRIMMLIASTLTSAALHMPARTVATHSRAATSMIAPEMTNVEVKKPTVEGPTFSKSLATPDPIPEEGQKRALELMKSGALFRYTPGVESETALAPCGWY